MKQRINENRAVKIKGLTLSELVVVVLAVLLLVGVLMPGLSRSRQTMVRLLCQSNLEGIGRAMAAFANDNAGRYPRAGCEASIWSTTGNIWDWAPVRFRPPGQLSREDVAFEVTRDENGEVDVAGGGQGHATITSSFYMLIRYSMATPKQFVCKGDVGAVEWRIEEEPGARKMGYYMTRGFDFGSGDVIWPGEVVTYSYHIPYSLVGSVHTFVITDLSNPASPVCADRNPYLDKNAPEPPGEPNGIRSFNSASHLGRGQNVLYKDGHVKFETSPIVGLAGDNIYTYRLSWGEDATLGTGPVSDGDPMAYPLDESDALLVGEWNGRSR